MEIEGASLYEINKQLSANQSKLGAAARKKAQEDVRLWFRDQIDEYAMLLCHEQRDYTIFHVVASPADAAAALFDCIDNRGELISIDPVDNNMAWEIWIRMESNNYGIDTETGKIEESHCEDYCYYLFCYDSAVINC